jgi:predicted ATPase
MVHLRSISLQHEPPLPEIFPYNIPVIKALNTLEFPTPITFFVGENGSGKSTVLEAIAVAANLPTIGGQDSERDETLEDIRRLSQAIRWVWSKRVRNGFFMRSEDFFGFAKRIAQQSAYMKKMLEGGDDEDEFYHEGQSEFARSLSKQAYAREYESLKHLYGDGLDAQSHGESYFKLFNARFRPSGLYLMDEPEAPLSPNRQLTLIAMFKQMIAQDAQFIIATHSPILLAYPDATIYNFEHGQIVRAKYEELEHVQITRGFLNNPDAYLKHLME